MGLFARAVFAHRGWRYRTRVDPDEIRWMRSVLRPGDLAVDVGAYKGGYTYWMRHQVGTEGLVLAFEPQPDLAAYLRARVSELGWTNVRIHDVALSREPGVAPLYRPGTEPSPAASLVGASLPRGSRRFDVRLRTLDAVLAEQEAEARGETRRPLRLVKCDVEGHEMDVFLGASDTLKVRRPHLLFECEARHVREGSMRDVFCHLEGLGYRGAFFSGGAARPLSDFRRETHQVEGRRPYVNNFVFTPAERSGS